MTKQRRRKKGLAEILSVTMAVGLIPGMGRMKVSAETAEMTAKAETPSVTAYATPGQLKDADNFTLHTDNGTGVAQKVYFGTNGGGAQTWYIAGYNEEKNSLVMMCDPRMPCSKCINIGGFAVDHYVVVALPNEIFNESEKIMLNSLFMGYNEYGEGNYIQADGIMIALQSANGTEGSPYTVPGCEFWIKKRVMNDDDETYPCAVTGNGVGESKIYLDVRDVVPAFSLDMDYVLFASRVPAGALSEVLSDAMTFRCDGTGKVTSTAIYEKNGVKVTKGGDNEYLCIQWKEDGTDKVYTTAIMGDINITKEKVGVDSFENCKIWTEKVEDNIAYAVEAAVDHNVPSEFDVNGFKKCSWCGEILAYEPAAKNDNNIYEIINAGQLCWFAQQVNKDNSNYGSANAVLINDITVNKGTNTGDVAKCDGTKTEGWMDWTPIGNDTCQYTGTFNGKNHIISGLYGCDDENNCNGLFGYLGKEGKICNVGVEDSYLEGKNYVSGICGRNEGTIVNCYNTGTVVSKLYSAAGVCSSNEGIIERCYNSGEVRGAENGTNESYYGGVCGSNKGVIKACYNTGSVSGNGHAVGGVCGYNNSAAIKNSYNTGIVKGTAGTNDEVFEGSVCGYDYMGTINDCYYLTGTNNAALGKISDSSRIEVFEKTADDFTGGGVAYLLQASQTANAYGVITHVWGQTLSGEGREEHPVLGGAKIYKTIGCTGGYSNEENDNKNHDFGQGNVCKDCGWDKGIIENKAGEEGYPAEFMYSGTAITAPTADNFTVNSGAAPAFTWYKGDVTAAEDLSAAEDAKLNETPVNAGTYTLVVTADAVAGEMETDKDYLAAELRVKVLVQKADSKVVTPPEGVSGLVYDSGRNLTLINNTGVSVTGGDIQYALGDSDGTYGKELPTVTDAGKYKVYYKVAGDDNHNDTVPAEIEVTVAQAMPEYTVPVNLKANCGDKLSEVSLSGTGFVWTDDTDAVLEAGDKEDGQTVTKTAKYVPADSNNYKEVTGIQLSVTVTHNLSAKQAVGNEGSEKHDSHCSACNMDFNEAPCSGGVATCSKRAVCSICGGNYGEINPDNHLFTKYAADNDAGCITNGHETAECDYGCGKKKTREIAESALGHEFDTDFTVDVEPTCAKAGSKSRHCVRCDEKADVTVIDKLTAHSYVNGVCSVCDDIFRMTVDGITYQVMTETGTDGKTVGKLVTVPGSDVPQIAVQITGADETQGGSALDGKIVLPSTIEESSSGQNYVVTGIAENAFAGDNSNAVTEIVVPDTVTEVGTGAFGDITTITFKGNTAPAGIKDAIGDKAKVNVPDGAVESFKDALGDKADVVEEHTHTHTYADEWTYDATGHWHASTCGHEEAIADKASHTFSSWIQIRPATEDETGMRERSCVCGYKEIEIIPKLTITAPSKGKKLTDTKNKAVFTVTKAAKVTTSASTGKVTITAGEVAYTKSTNAGATTLTIPSSVKINGITYKVTSIGANAFANNKKLTKVTMGSYVKTIGGKAFYKCTKLKTVNIGKSVTIIGASAFYECTKLDTVSMGAKVTTISDKAFYKCTALKAITIPATVSKIGKQAFYGCKNLKTVTIKTTKLSGSKVGSKAFTGIYAKATVKVPKSKYEAYKKLLKSRGLGAKAVIKK